MNREEFMNELAFLLQDIPEEEKEEVLQYYNDYFEEGGEAQEAKIVRELESPEKVAAIIKDGLGTNPDKGEFSERGYHDERFMRKMEGTFANELKIECGVGEITTNVYGKYEDYNHKVDCGVGSVLVGTNKYSGLGSSQEVNNKAPNTIKIDCGVGSISVNFKQ